MRTIFMKSNAPNLPTSITLTQFMIHPSSQWTSPEWPDFPAQERAYWLKPRALNEDIGERAGIQETYFPRVPLKEVRALWMATWQMFMCVFTGRGRGGVTIIHTHKGMMHSARIYTCKRMYIHWCIQSALYGNIGQTWFLIRNVISFTYFWLKAMIGR